MDELPRSGDATDNSNLFIYLFIRSFICSFIWEFENDDMEPSKRHSALLSFISDLIYLLIYLFIYLFIYLVIYLFIYLFNSWDTCTQINCLVFETVNSQFCSIDQCRLWVKYVLLLASIGPSGGRQRLSLGNGCEQRGTAIHELMHALGFFREQSRLDRDKYITIIWSNIEQGMPFERHALN